jgi:hypothetical protein
MQRRTGNDEASSSRAARLFGKRTALVLCGSVATWFMISSVAQLVAGVFPRGVVPLAGGPAESSEQRCAEGVRRAAALEPGPPQASPGPPEGPQGDLEACSLTSAGLDALAALERLQKAKEQLGQRDPASVASLRFDLSAHLPAEMR